MSFTRKSALVHSILVALISVCNYFIKVNDAIADTCNYTQLSACSQQCGAGLYANCVASPGYTSGMSCTCECRSGDEYYGDYPCYWALNNPISCNNGSKIYCFSFDRHNEVCDSQYGSLVKCRRVYMLDSSASRNACSCRYVSSHGGDNLQCYNSYNYGSICQYECPFYSGLRGYRNTYAVGGSITDCRVYVAASCDNSGCFDSHTCPYLS